MSTNFKSYDQDTITQSVIDAAAEEFWTIVNDSVMDNPSGFSFYNKKGDFVESGGIESLFENLKSDPDFVSAAVVWEESYVFASSAKPSDLGELQDLFGSNVRAAAIRTVGELRAAIKQAESQIAADSNLAPDGAELPIDEQVSTDENREAMLVEQERSKAAAQEQAAAEKKKEEGEERADSLQFKEQCFVLAQMHNIIDFKYKTVSKFKKLPYVPDTIQTSDIPSNASILLHDDPFNFINKLLIYPDTKEYMDMKTEEIANLQPEIRFYKSVFDPEIGENINTEIKFDTTLTNPREMGTDIMQGSTALESLLNDKRKRATGVGIKKFDLSFIGTDPFAAKKDLRGKLVLYCASFDELFKVRKNSINGRPYRYIDMALKTVTTEKGATALSEKINLAGRDSGNMTQSDTTTDDVTSLNFAIKAQIGIRPPKKTVAHNENLMESIKRNSVTVQMTPVTHQFDFNEDGSLNFSIDYVPFIADGFNSSLFDVFGASADNLANKIIIRALNKACDPEAVTKHKEFMQLERKTAIKMKFATIVNRLFEKQQIHYITIPAQEVKKFNSKGPYKVKKGDIFGDKQDPDKDKSAEQKTKDEIKHEADIKKAEEEAKNIVVKNSAGRPVSINDVNVPYFYLHDLVDVVLENVEKNLKPDLMDLEYLQKVVEDAQKSIYESENIDTEPEDSLSKKQTAFNFKLKATKMINDYVDKYNEAYYNFKKFRVLLGPIEIVDPRDPKNVKIISIGDIPITVGYFNEFIAKQVIGADRTSFPISQFLNKLMNKLVSSFMNSDKCFGGDVRHRVRVARTEALCYNKHPRYDDLTNRIVHARRNALNMAGIKHGTKPKDSLTLAGIPVVDRLPLKHMEQPVLKSVGLGANALDDDTISQDQYSYLIFYGARTNAIERFKGIKKDDVARGCHHYMLGRDRGIVKTIKLQRDNRPMLKEMRFESSGFNGLKQLIEVYNINVESYANFNVFPGAKVYVDPAGWAPMLDAETMQAIGDFKNLTELGIGGYYDITKVEHSFAPGEFNTSFVAYWTNGIGDPDNLPDKKPSESKKTKCKTKEDDDAGSSSSTTTNAVRSDAKETPGFMSDMLEIMGVDASNLSDPMAAVKGVVNQVFKINGPPSAGGE